MIIKEIELFRQEETGYGGYQVRDANTGQVVGTCAFKSAPTQAGVIEIAYYTFPPYENQGYGTAMAKRLVDIALENPAVIRVTARTLREQNASTSILKKIGMNFAGEVQDPEDGPVWEWELLRQNNL